MPSFGGQIYRNGKLTKGILHVEDGIITKIARTATMDDHHDFGDRAILPGAIDVHVHFREPGSTHKEDLHSGSVGAAFGGVTGFVDMPNTLPPTTTPKLLREKHRLAAEKAVVDYGFWAGATWYTGDVAEMLQWAVGVKAYLGATTGDLLLEDPGAFRDMLRICGEAGRPVILHCEAQRILEQYRRTEMELSDHDAGRPPLAEVESIYDVMKAVTGLKTAPPVHVAHIASADAVQAATAAKFSRGVCPHHLLLDTETFEGPPGTGKMNPPLRGVAQREALWKAFLEGKVAIVESDHAPHTNAEKSEPFHQVPAGVPGVETMVPLLLATDAPLATVVDAVTTAPAQLLGLEDRGRLEVGMRADFAVYDLETTTPVEGKKLHSKCGWTPYEGMAAVFPSHTYLRGNPVIEDGILVAKAGGESLIDLPEAP